MSNGIFVDARGDFSLSEELLCAVKARMRELADEAIPIMKRSINTDDAVELFHQYRMYDKERLFSTAAPARVNIYSIGNSRITITAYMVQNTGYIKYFDLKLYEDGLFWFSRGARIRKSWRSLSRCPSSTARSGIPLSGANSWASPTWET